MKPMIPGLGDMWLREEDLEADIPGRKDGPALIANCVKVVRGHRVHLATSGHRVYLATSGVNLDLKVRNALVHAKVQSAFARPVPHEARELQQKDETIRQLQDAVSRLLAFVPQRSEPLSEERRLAIGREIGTAANELFAGHKFLITLADETDDDTIACHRLTLTVFMDKGDDVDKLIDAEMELRKRYVGMVSNIELRALRFLVEYSPASSREASRQS